MGGVAPMAGVGEGPLAESPADPAAATQAGEDPSVGVVTPHNGQRGLCGAVLPGSVTANTVEKYQGDERDVIIVSGTVSDPDFARQEEDFLLDPRRLLVAISRSRYKTIVTCSEALFEVAPDDDRLDAGLVWNRLFLLTAGRDATPAWAGSLAAFTDTDSTSTSDATVEVYPSTR